MHPKRLGEIRKKLPYRLVFVVFFNSSPCILPMCSKRLGEIDRSFLRGSLVFIVFLNTSPCILQICWNKVISVNCLSSGSLKIINGEHYRKFFPTRIQIWHEAQLFWEKIRFVLLSVCTKISFPFWKVPCWVVFVGFFWMSGEKLDSQGGSHGFIRNFWES